MHPPYASCPEDLARRVRSSTVFVLPPWKEIYVSDAERYENYEQAVLIHKHLMETYTNYGYAIVEVPKDTVENRIEFIMKQLVP